MEPFFIHNYNYDLEEKHIAYHPLKLRDDSKLLVYSEGLFKHDKFGSLGSNLPLRSTLVLNNSKVINARITFQKVTGGKIEIFCLEPHAPDKIHQALQSNKPVQWKCLIGGASKWKRGEILRKEIIVDGLVLELTAHFIAKTPDCFVIEFRWPWKIFFADVLQAAGSIPLPPYIKRSSNVQDLDRYQTIFATVAGSVAAPTASLHFSDKVFDDLREKNIHTEYLTLHVGAGTFKPVQTETIQEHVMHAETFSITTSALENLIKSTNIIAVGTTSLRTLESLYWMGIKLINGDKEPFTISQWEVYDMEANEITYAQSLHTIIQYLNANKLDEIWGKTSLLIVPGYSFKSAGGLITNFHQPKSTLLLLIAAFVGDDWKKIYDYALENNYRFLSYGDSSLLWKNPMPDFF